MSRRVSARAGQREERGPLQFRAAAVHVPLSALLTAWLLRKLGHAAGWLLRRPMLLGPLVGGWLLVRLVDAHGTALALGTLLLSALVIVALVVWRFRFPASFTRTVGWRVRGGWRSLVVYRAGWSAAMSTTGLAVSMAGRDYLPKRVSVSSTGTVDRVRVRMLPGQVLDDWATVASRLAQTFDAQDCRVRSMPPSAGRALRRVGSGRQQLELWFLTRDPLTDPIAPKSLCGMGSDEVTAAVDLAALPVGLCEDGTTYRLRLLDTQLLVVGATGSGKGSVVWSTLHALGPAIRDGMVSVWCLDPKGGMELAPGRGLFARFVYGDPDDGSFYEHEFAYVLEEAVTVMRHRQSLLRGVTRLHRPTPAEPLILVVIDELASLTSYVTDRDAKRRIAAALSLLLSQGRAVGVCVLGAVQDPRKDILTVRDLFPTRVCLRTSEPEHVALVLGQGARDRGARCDQIPESLPGVGYVGIDGHAEPVRVRFAHITDDHITALVHQYAPRPLVHAADGDSASSAVAELTRGRVA